MQRTKNRPIPSGRMSVNTAFFYSFFIYCFSVWTLYNLNPKTANNISAISIFLYTCVYTPLKTKHHCLFLQVLFPEQFLSCLVGLLLLPESLEWNQGFICYSIFWQFPHFWAIGWFLFEDYEKGGFLCFLLESEIGLDLQQYKLSCIPYGLLFYQSSLFLD